uniref:Uncharacterized protein n=1 Tax=Anguilla anguilla TaxID=7936 RepID=A0A0E9TEL3_ANGAN
MAEERVGCALLKFHLIFFPLKRLSAPSNQLPWI